MNAFGLEQFWAGADPVIRGVALLLAIMSLASWYVIALKSLDPSKPVLSPEQTKREVGRIVRKVEKKTGKKSREVDVFDQIQSFAINADAEMVDQLLREDVVTAAQFGGTSD